MIKQMNYKILGLFALILLLGACSGWKKTSESTFKTSSTNVDVDTVPLKIHGNDNSSSIKIFGKEVKKNKEKEQFFPENPKQFINGDVCKYCDYIGRTENEQGNLIEAEMAHGFKNGEEREYSDGEIIRSSYYSDGRRSGMEYYFSGRKAVDSAFVETIFGSEWDRNKVKAALPKPVAGYIYKEYIQDNALGLYAFTLGNDMITQIARYNVHIDDYVEKGTYTPIIKFFYDNHRDFSNFKVIFLKPFHEEITIKNKELVERNKIKGNKNVLEFRQGEFSKEYYDNGTIKKLVTGDVTFSLEDNADSCRSMCQAQWFYENGIKRKDYFFVDGQLKQGKEWNEKGSVISEFENSKNRRTYYDNGHIKDEYKGDVRIENNFVVMQNGTYETWHSNGILESKTERNEGIDISQQMWDSTGFLILDYERNKYLKKMENTTPVKRKEWIGIVTTDGKPTFSADSVIEKEYHGDVLVFEMHKSAFNPLTKNFKDFYSGAYDSSGTKKREFTNKNDTIVFWKEWIPLEDSATGRFLKYDYNANSYFKSYKEPGKMNEEFKGKSVWKLGEQRTKLPNFIDGASTIYTSNGKKRTEMTWKNGKMTSGKQWSENGVLTTDFDLEKYVKFFSDKTKKTTLYFKGTSRYSRGESKDEKVGFMFIDGVSQEFDESGKLLTTKIYKNESLVTETKAQP